MQGLPDVCYVFSLLRSTQPSIDSEAMEKHPLEILVYAVKHDLTDLGDLAAPMTVGFPLAEVQNRFAIGVFVAWARNINIVLLLTLMVF